MQRTSDVIVIGGGIIGCAVAYEVASRGAAVTVVDGRGIGRGATRASAGILSPHIEGHDRGVLLDIGVRSLALYDEFVARVIADTGCAIPFGRIGTLEVALADESADHLRAAAASQHARGVKSLLLDGLEAREAEPRLCEGVQAALLIPEHAFVSAPHLVQALERALAARDAHVVKARALRVTRPSRGLSVETDEGDVLSADTVVLAAGSWSGGVELENLPPLPVKPVRGQLLRLAWPGPALAHTTWGARCYMVPWPDGTLLVGATVEDAGFDERTTVAGVRDLLDAACELVPVAWQAGFIDARAGLRPASPDELPIVGRSTRLPGLVYATAHYRNGVLLAPLTAQLVAAIVEGDDGDPALAAMAPGRFGEF